MVGQHNADCGFFRFYRRIWDDQGGGLWVYGCRARCGWSECFFAIKRTLDRLSIQHESYDDIVRECLSGPV